MKIKNLLILIAVLFFAPAARAVAVSQIQTQTVKVAETEKNQKKQKETYAYLGFAIGFLILGFLSPLPFLALFSFLMALVCSIIGLVYSIKYF